MRNYAWAAVLAVGLASSSPALAADLTTPAPAPIQTPAPTGWRFEATAYGWASNLTGNMGVGPFPTMPVNASFVDILQHLDGVFMGSFVGRNDTYIFGLDLIWTRLSSNTTYEGLPPPGILNGASVTGQLSQTIGTAFGGYRLPIGSRDLSLYGTIGLRYYDMSGSITLQTPVVGFERSASQTKDWLDPIVGLAAHYRIDDKWFVDALADVGGYSGSATSQALAAVGYNWNQSISTSLGYRVLYTYYQQSNGANGSFRNQSTMYGPLVSLSYGF
jgi:hypothetical protein